MKGKKMNPVVMTALNWSKNRLINFVVYALIGLAVWGVTYKLFWKDSSVTTNTGQVQYYWQGAKVNVYPAGCATLQTPKGVK